MDVYTSASCCCNDLAVPLHDVDVPFLRRLLADCHAHFASP